MLNRLFWGPSGKTISFQARISGQTATETVKIKSQATVKKLYYNINFSQHASVSTFCFDLSNEYLYYYLPNKKK
jgi:hypothetical protein